MCPIYKSEFPQKHENYSMYKEISINDCIGQPFNVILYNMLDTFF